MINFNSLREKYSNIDDAWDIIEKWFEDHPNPGFIRATDIHEGLDPIKDFSKVISIIVCIHDMINEGYLVAKWKAISREGYLSDETYDEIEDIPKDSYDLTIGCELVKQEKHSG